MCFNGIGNIVGFYFHSMDGTYIDIPWENADTMQTDPDALENSWAEKTTMSIPKLLKIAKGPLEGNIR